MIESLKAKELWVRWFFVTALLAGFTYINWPFLIPISLAGIFALGLHDFIFKIAKKTKWKYNVTVFLTVAAGLALFWIPLSLAIYRVIGHVSQPQAIETDRIVVQINALKDFAIAHLQRISEWTGTDLATPVRSLVESLLKKTGEILFNYSSHVLGQLPSIILASFVFTLVLFFLLLKARDIKTTVLKYSPFEPETLESLVSIFKNSCSVTLASTLAVGLIQAFLIGLGSLIFGEGDFWLILTITFLVSFIPVIGAAPVGYTLALLAFLGDRLGPAIGMAVIATAAGTIDNLLKPLIMSGANRVSPVIAFTCVVGAVIMMGLPGLLLGPVIMNLFVGIAPLLLKEKQSP